jgi:hypothetical protein
MIAHTSRDQDSQVYNGWSNADIKAKLFDVYPESVAHALRPLVARFADNTDKITDPATVLLDLGHIVDSLAGAATELIRDYGLDQGDPDIRRDIDEALTGLHAASAALDSLGNNI